MSASERVGESRAYLVLLNWGGAPAECVLPARVARGYTCAVANYPGADAQPGARLTLRPWEARVYRGDVTRELRPRRG